MRWLCAVPSALLCALVEWQYTAQNETKRNETKWNGTSIRSFRWGKQRAKQRFNQLAMPARLYNTLQFKKRGASVCLSGHNRTGSRPRPRSVCTIYTVYTVYTVSAEYKCIMMEQLVLCKRVTPLHCTPLRSVRFEFGFTAHLGPAVVMSFALVHPALSSVVCRLVCPVQWVAYSNAR